MRLIHCSVLLAAFSLLLTQPRHTHTSIPAISAHSPAPLHWSPFSPTRLVPPARTRQLLLSLLLTQPRATHTPPLLPSHPNTQPSPPPLHWCPTRLCRPGIDHAPWSSSHLERLGKAPMPAGTVTDDDQVLSEVHLGTPPAATHWRTSFRVRAAFRHAAMPALVRAQCSPTPMRPHRPLPQSPTLRSPAESAHPVWLARAWAKPYRVQSGRALPFLRRVL